MTIPPTDAALCDSPYGFGPGHMSRDNCLKPRFHDDEHRGSYREWPQGYMYSGFFDEDPEESGNNCHSGTDGDCIWEHCPQERDYRPICPLYVQDPER